MIVPDVLGVLNEDSYELPALELAMQTKDPDFWLKLNKMYYARDGREISLAGWSVRREVSGYRWLDRTSFEDLEVSTVWLGIDHGFMQGAPVIFETMVFQVDPSTRQWTDDYERFMDRYCTEREALKGHSDICRKIKSGWRGATEQ